MGFLIGIGCAGLGGFLIYLNLSEVSNSPWCWYIGIPLVLFGVIKVGMIVSPLKYYCMNCGQYLGNDEPNKCPRCGSNRFTTQDPKQNN